MPAKHLLVRRLAGAEFFIIWRLYILTK